MKKVVIIILLLLITIGCTVSNTSRLEENTTEPTEEPVDEKVEHELEEIPTILTPIQIAEYAFPSVVLLSMVDEYGQPSSLASGFFVTENLVITNYHVIVDTNGGYGKVIGKDQKFDIEGIVGVDPLHDLALLKLKDAKEIPLEIQESMSIKIGQKIFALGNPMGLEGTFSEGIVSGIRELDTDSIIQITAPISPGSSGGPIIDSTGEVVGVAVATYSGGQNLNFAIPTKYITDLLQEQGDLISFNDIKSKEKSLLERLGGDSIEGGVIGESFLWDDEYEFSGSYTFTIRNKLKSSISDVYILVIFNDNNNLPLDINIVHYEDIIPPGLAKRVHSSTDSSVKKLITKPSIDDPYFLSLEPYTKIEYRILNFEILE